MFSADAPWPSFASSNRSSAAPAALALSAATEGLFNAVAHGQS
jgi:hypothetical protein